MDIIVKEEYSEQMQMQMLKKKILLQLMVPYYSWLPLWMGFKHYESIDCFVQNLITYWD